MQSKFRRWLDALPLSDTLERRQAGLLQIMLLIILGSCAIGLLISLSSASESASLGIALTSYTLLIGSTQSALILLGR